VCNNKDRSAVRAAPHSAGVVAAIVHRDREGKLLATTASNIGKRLTHPRPESKTTYWCNMGLSQRMAAYLAAQAARGGVDDYPYYTQYQGYPNSQLYDGGPPPSHQQEQTPYAAQDQKYEQYVDSLLKKYRARLANAQYPSGSQDFVQYFRELKGAIGLERLQSSGLISYFQALETAQRCAQQVDKLVAAWHIPREIAAHIVR
jgi:hypothetical protein